MWIAVGLMAMDPMIVLTRVTAPAIFGTIIVLNMLQNSLFQRMAQPVKGVLNTAAALVFGVVFANVYGLVSPKLVGALASGPPGYDYEIWLVNALLSVTFPFLVFYAACLAYWPLTRATEATGAPART
jgi:hypothetical protein